MRNKFEQLAALLNKLFFLFSLLLFSITTFSQVVFERVTDCSSPGSNVIEVNSITGTAVTDVQLIQIMQ